MGRHISSKRILSRRAQKLKWSVQDSRPLTGHWGRAELWLLSPSLNEVMESWTDACPFPEFGPCAGLVAVEWGRRTVPPVPIEGHVGLSRPAGAVGAVPVRTVGDLDGRPTTLAADFCLPSHAPRGSWHPGPVSHVGPLAVI